MADKTLFASEASVKTCAVDVKVIRIGTKQMTLSVFRQLYREKLIAPADPDGDCSLHGTPWGLVNYHSVCSGGIPGHLHVVWQKGSELRRACVEPAGSWLKSDLSVSDGFDILGPCGYDRLGELISLVRRHAGHVIGLTRPARYERSADPLGRGNCWVFPGLAKVKEDNSWPWESLIKYWQNLPDLQRERYDTDETYARKCADRQTSRETHKAAAAASLQRFAEDLARDGVSLSSGPDHDAVMREAIDLIQQITVRRERVRCTYQRCYDKLAALDQLFIAV